MRCLEWESSPFNSAGAVVFLLWSLEPRPSSSHIKTSCWENLRFTGDISSIWSARPTVQLLRAPQHLADVPYLHMQRLHATVPKWRGFYSQDAAAATAGRAQVTLITLTSLCWIHWETEKERCQDPETRAAKWMQPLLIALISTYMLCL